MQREKVNFKSREVKRFKECALALNSYSEIVSDTGLHSFSQVRAWTSIEFSSDTKEVKAD